MLRKNITDKETFRSGSAALIVLDPLLQAFGQPSCLDVSNENVQKHYPQAFDYCTRPAPNCSRYVVLCKLKESREFVDNGKELNGKT